MKGILINYEYCTGCHSCEIACRNELGLGRGEFGIKMTEVGPFKYENDLGFGTRYEWVYNPTLTKACNMCSERTEMGKMPSCVQACQAWCMYYGELSELIEKMDGATRWALYSAIDRDKAAPAPIECMNDKSALRAAAFSQVETAPQKHEPAPINVDDNTVVNLEVTNEEKFQEFVAAYANVDYEAAKAEFLAQFVADSKADKFVLPAEKASDGAAHEIAYQGVALSYDAQGTQLGGGKAYLDKGQPVARVDITVIF